MRYLLVTGIFRSGTTLLARVLSGHPEIEVAWQPYWLFFRMVRNAFREKHDAGSNPDMPMGLEWQSSSSLKGKFRHVFEDIHFSEQMIHDLCRDLYAYLNHDPKESLNHGLKPRHILARLGHLRSGPAGDVLLQLMEMLMRGDAESKGQETQRIIGLKEIFVEEFIDPLRASFGKDFGFVHIIRDPRGVVASRNYGRYREETGTVYPLRFIADSWNRSVRLGLKNQGTELFYLLRFEDLVSDPIKFLKEAYDTMQVSCDSMWREIHNKISAITSSNSSFSSGAGISQEPLKRWRKVLSQAEIAFIEKNCRQSMARMGYALKNDRLKKNVAVHEETSLFPRWLAEYYLASADI